MATREGRCLCGEVRFSAELESEDYGACHCATCRRWAGGPVVEAQASALEFTGRKPAIYRSSDWGERLFCPNCGTLIGFRMADGSFHGLSAGAFDPPLSGRLVMEVFVDSKPEGYAFAGDHQRLTGAEVLALMQGGGEGS